MQPNETRPPLFVCADATDPMNNPNAALEYLGRMVFAIRATLDVAAIPAYIEGIISEIAIKDEIVRICESAPPSERSAEQRRQIAQLDEQLTTSQVLRLLYQFMTGYAAAEEHKDGARCTGRKPSGAYCICQLGQDLRRVDRSLENHHGEKNVN